MNEQETHLFIIEKTPLVSVDLLLRNSEGRVLLGKRVNRPAQGFWFVPGGSIRKNERIADAIIRVARVEVGVTLTMQQIELAGAYDHIYPDNFAGVEGITTHYVVLAYRAVVEERVEGDAQHSELKWWAVADLLQDRDVHPNVKAYFR